MKEQQVKSTNQRYLDLNMVDTRIVDTVLDTFNKIRDANKNRASTCCPGSVFKDTQSVWPPFDGEGGAKHAEITLKLILKYVEFNCKLQGFRYKVHQETYKLSAFQMLYTHGIEGPVFKAKNETEEGMTTILLEDK